MGEDVPFIIPNQSRHSIPSMSTSPSGTTAAAAASTLPSRVIAVDTAISRRIHDIFHPIFPRPFLKLLELSGDGRLWIPIPISLLLSSPAATRHLTPFLLALLAGFLLDLALVGALKHLVRRPRPVYNRDMFLTFAVDHWSFPSGHSSRVFFIVSFLWLCCGMIPAVQRWRELVLGWAVMTSVSRIFLGRHFLLDVAAGAWLGVLEDLSDDRAVLVYIRPKSPRLKVERVIVNTSSIINCRCDDGYHQVEVQSH